jgi:hypothetical protein
MLFFLATSCSLIPRAMRVTRSLWPNARGSKSSDMASSPCVVDKCHSAKAGSRADSCYFGNWSSSARLRWLSVASPGPWSNGRGSGRLHCARAWNHVKIAWRTFAPRPQFGCCRRDPGRFRPCGIHDVQPRLRFPDLESAERTTAYRRLHAASPPRGALRSEVAMKSENDDLTACIRLLRESFGFTGRGGQQAFVKHLAQLAQNR